MSTRRIFASSPGKIRRSTTGTPSRLSLPLPEANRPPERISMPVSSVELNARQDIVKQPIVWRLGKLFNVVTNIRRARVTDDYGTLLLEIEGSSQEVQQATDYLIGLGLIRDREAVATASAPRPEDAVPQT